MAFAGLSVAGILLAAFAGWLVGAVWYTTLARHWIAALGEDEAGFKTRQAAKGRVAMALPFVLSFLAEVVMAWVLAGTLGHLGPGQVTVRNGLISAAFLWGGFVLTTVAVNNAYAGRSIALTAIDAGHWLLAMLVMGAVIGWMAV